LGIAIGVYIGPPDHSDQISSSAEEPGRRTLKKELKEGIISKAQKSVERPKSLPILDQFKKKKVFDTKQDERISGASWMAHAVPFENIENKPLVSIVLDDMGLNQFHSDWAISLKAPLTLSYLPYAKNLADQTQSARAEGHELLIHLPMEPRGNADPGPGALMVNMDQIEIKKRLARALYLFPGAIGVNNHMGSLFTADQRVMSIVLTQIKSSGQLFLDSLTTSNSLVAQLGDKLNVPVVSRDVFLDDIDKEDEIVRRLREVERVALDKGTAIAIGHPRVTTLRVLEKWLANLAEKKIRLAPLSAVAKTRLNRM
jgi:polysaccharide deacetylase 2 family uncharacterized protein YibQ